MSFAQPRTVRTISAAAPGVPSPKIVGSTPLRSLSMCCSTTQTSRQLHQDLRQCNGAEFAWTRLWQLLSWLWCLRSADKWGDRSRRPELRRSAWDRCLSPGAYPVAQHSWPTFRASNGRNVSIASPTRTRFGRQRNTPDHTFHQLRWWWREFRCSMFDRCTLHVDPHDPMCVCLNSNE